MGGRAPFGFGMAGFEPILAGKLAPCALNAF
jgi:hypothetical protein